LPRWQQAYDSSTGCYYYYCEELQVRRAINKQHTL
jgi:hypothetical protein